MNKLFLCCVLLLTGCIPERPPRAGGDDENIKVVVLRSTKDVADITDVGIVCIDGVKYVHVPEVGISMKFITDGKNIPVPELCAKR